MRKLVHIPYCNRNPTRIDHNLCVRPSLLPSQFYSHWGLTTVTLHALPNRNFYIYQSQISILYIIFFFLNRLTLDLIQPTWPTLFLYSHQCSSSPGSCPCSWRGSRCPPEGWWRRWRESDTALPLPPHSCPQYSRAQSKLWHLNNTKQRKKKKGHKGPQCWCVYNHVGTSCRKLKKKKKKKKRFLTFRMRLYARGSAVIGTVQRQYSKYKS